MRRQDKATILIAITIIYLSLTCLLINNFFFQYSANNYFPPNYLAYIPILFLIYVGCLIYWGVNSKYTLMSNELNCYFMMFSVIALATTAVQLTPFWPIDELLINIDNVLYVNNVRLLNWLNHYPNFKQLLVTAYDLFYIQLIAIPLSMIVLHNKNSIWKFYFLMLFSTLIGFTFYYFYPTVGPASTYQSSLFTQQQFATGLKFYQIHHKLIPTTIEGGLIAMPSFHIIWSWYCLYISFDTKWLFYPTLIYNIILYISCVILGWHYFVDVLGSVIIILLSHYTLHKMSD
jgi:PAP2 superfamily